MNIIAFPYKNHYFNVGFSALQESGTLYTRHFEPTVAVSISRWSLKEVVSSPWIETPGSVNIIIIFHAQLLPLARYYQINNEKVIAIFEESESMKIWGGFRGHLANEKTEPDYLKPYLTDKEFISLRYSLKGVSAKEQARAMGLCTKTVFTFRYNLARKLKVNKVKNLLCGSISDVRSHGLSTTGL